MKKQLPENLKTRPDLTDEEWIAWTAAQPENRGIDVRSMYRNMLEWCLKKGVTPTRRRLLRWLDSEREAMPLTYEPPYFEKPVDPNGPCGECSGERKITVNDLRSPCPKCRPAEEMAFWRSRGR